jgi:hypothetical protein
MIEHGGTRHAETLAESSPRRSRRDFGAHAAPGLVLFLLADGGDENHAREERGVGVLPYTHRVVLAVVERHGERLA